MKVITLDYPISAPITTKKVILTLGFFLMGCISDIKNSLKMPSS